MKANKGSFPIQLKKILPFFCCLLLSILVINVSHAQSNSHGYVPMNSKGTTYKRLASDSTSSFPTGCGAPSGVASLRGGTAELAAQYFDSCGKTMYIFDPSDSTWVASSSAAANGECYRNVLIDSSNFDDATKFTDATLAGTTIIRIISEDVPAFLYEGTDYTLVDSGATIDLADFDATAEQYHFLVIAVDTTGACSNAITINETASPGIDNITGLIEPGTNVTIDGSGTSEDPYVINSSGGGATDTSNLRNDITHLQLHYTLQTITYSSSITMDSNDGFNGQVTLTGDATFDISNLQAGDAGWILVTQDGTGGRVLTFPAGTKIALGYGGSQVPDLSTTAGKTDMISYVFDGTNLFLPSVIRDFQ